MPLSKTRLPETTGELDISANVELPDGDVFQVSNSVRTVEILAGICLVLCVFSTFLLYWQDGRLSFNAAWLLAPLMAAVLGLTRSGRGKLATHLFLWGMLVAIAASSYLVDGVRTPILYLLPVAAMATAWLLGRREAWVMFAVATLWMAWLSYAEVQGWLPHTSRSTLSYFITMFSVMIAAVLLGDFAAQGFIAQYRKVKALNESLRQHGAYLEERIAQRTKEIESAKNEAEAANSALCQLNASLEARVAERTAELTKAKDAAEAANLAKSKASMELQAFAQEQNRAIEQERRAMAREVHDQIGQVFTAIKLIIDSLPRVALPAEQDKELAQALAMGIASTRRVTAELRPPLLDDLGFAAAVTHYVKQHPGLTSIQCKVAISEDGALDATQSLALFRIIQESVTNVVRHAKASRLDIEGIADEGYILTIADDGCGLDPTVRPGALGLTVMRERAKLLGGECSIRSRPGGGTVVEVRLSPNENTQ